VPIQILKTVAVHEAMILGFVVGTAPRLQCAPYEIIYLVTAFTGDANQHLGKGGTVTNVFGRKGLKARFTEQHHAHLRRDHHAGRRRITELGIETKSQLAKEVDGPIQMFHGQIDITLSVHVGPAWLRYLLFSYSGSDQLSVARELQFSPTYNSCSARFIPVPRLRRLSASR
jgi:hypothetical protein